MYITFSNTFSRKVEIVLLLNFSVISWRASSKFPMLRNSSNNDFVHFSSCSRSVLSAPLRSDGPAKIDHVYIWLQ